MRRMAIAAALLFQLLGAPLPAQQPAQTREQLTKALQEYRAKNDLRGEATTLLNLGIAESGLDNADAARSNLTEAARKMSAQNDVVGAWLAFFTLSELEEAAGRTTEAIGHVEKALAVIDEARDSTAPFSLETLFTLWDSGLPRSALGFYEPWAGWMKPRILDGMLEPLTRDRYGSLLMEIGQLEQAEAELNKAVERLKDSPVEYEPMDARFGDLRFRQKRYDEARAHYQKGLDASSQTAENPAGDPLTEAWFCDRLARVETITGHPDEAKRWNDRMVEIARSRMSPEEPVPPGTGGHPQTPGERTPDTEAALTDALSVVKAKKDVAERARIELRFGQLEILNGNYGSAAAHLERAVQRYQSLNDPMSEMAAWESLCIVYLHTTNYAAMESALARAHKRVGTGQSPIIDDSFVWLETWLRYKKGQATLEDIEAIMERTLRRAAAANFERAQDVRQAASHMINVLEKKDFSGFESKSDDPLISQYARVMESMQEFQKGNLEGAREIWRDVLEKNPGNEAGSILQLMTGISYLMQFNVEDANRWFAEGTKTLEQGIHDIRSEVMLTRYLGDMRVYYDVILESLALFGKTAEGFDISERARARTFLRLLGNHRLKPPSGDGSSLVKEAEDLRKKIANWDEEPQPGVSLADLRRQYEALLPRIQAAAPEYSSLTSVPAQPLDAIRKALPENTTLVSYFVTPFGAHAWILDKESLEYVRLFMNEAQMRRISCWAFELARPRSAQPLDENGCSSDPATPAEAYATLIAPLRSKIRKERLMIVPHGDLHYVPFAALYDEERKRYLVEDYPITYVPSASTIPYLREKESAVRGAALVLGDPVTASQPRLPGAAREARKVAETLHATVKLGAAARESLLHGLDGKVDLLHIAAHGTYDAASPLFSAIHLAEGNGENGELTVDEIQSELDLSGVNLVVLSACRSGIGQGSGGDDIIGLTRSILYAGSPGVIATLWNISDDGTPPLIEKFYEHLLAGETAADALRAAQTELLRDPDLKHPRYWAAFFLTGDPQGNWKRPSSSAGTGRGAGPPAGAFVLAGEGAGVTAAGAAAPQAAGAAAPQD
ncbi:MAG TPA: CHAT domain-containing protein [Thermoanaerobaculia bacterium]|nr:CHAT domain-containing protein [Thermoanaerobaculia bacterium]